MTAKNEQEEERQHLTSSDAGEQSGKAAAASLMLSDSHGSGDSSASGTTTAASVARACKKERSSKVAPYASFEAERQDRQMIRCCVYALRSLMQHHAAAVVCPSPDQMRIFAQLIHAHCGEVAHTCTSHSGREEEWSADDPDSTDGTFSASDLSIPIACIRILGAYGCRKSDPALTAMISNLLMELLEESSLLIPMDCNDDADDGDGAASERRRKHQETSISGPDLMSTCPPVGKLSLM